MTDRRNPDVHRMVMEWPDDAVAEIESLRQRLASLEVNLETADRAVARNLVLETRLSAAEAENAALRDQLTSLRNDIEAAYNGLDYLTHLSVAEAADPNSPRRLAIDVAEIKGRLLTHMRRIDAARETT